jgi:predicted HAD superfamily Cof-like phosphohydrolase
MTRLKNIIQSIISTVREFRIASNLPVSEQFNPPKRVEELIQEHIWIKEEWIELWNAIQGNDDLEIADAYCDLIYFSAGAMLRFGMHTDIKDLSFNRRKVDLFDHVTLLNNVNVMHENEFIKIIYVAIYAFENKFPDVSLLKCFNEVHRSNMSKFCSHLQQATNTQQKYANEGKEVRIQKNGDMWVVKNRVDGKTLKSIDWVAPNLRKFIKA